jgi:integrase
MEAWGDPLEDVPPHVLRRTVQTLDQGARVSTYTVAREMGHRGEAMVRRVYGHLGRLRHRAEVVEYRVEQHAAKLGARLEALRGTGFGSTIGTTA